MEETKEERFIYVLERFFLIFLDRRNKKIPKIKAKRSKRIEKNIFLQLK